MPSAGSQPVMGFQQSEKRWLSIYWTRYRCLKTFLLIGSLFILLQVVLSVVSLSRICHGVPRKMRGFCVIKLPCSGIGYKLFPYNTQLRRLYIRCSVGPRTYTLIINAQTLTFRATARNTKQLCAGSTYVLCKRGENNGHVEYRV